MNKVVVVVVVVIIIIIIIIIIIDLLTLMRNVAPSAGISSFRDF